MPLDIDQKLIDQLVQREIAQEQMAPAAPAKDDGGVGTLTKLIYAIGGGADVASTLHGLKTGLVKESNPMVNWAPRGAQVPIGMAMELGGVYAANKLFGKKKPGLMKAILLGLGGVHGGLAAKNMATIASARKDAETARTAAPAPPAETTYWNPTAGM